MLFHDKTLISLKDLGDNSIAAFLLENAIQIPCLQQLSIEVPFFFPFCVFIELNLNLCKYIKGLDNGYAKCIKSIARVGNMLKENTSLKELTLVCFFLSVVQEMGNNNYPGDQYRFCLLDKESSSLSTFRNNWNTFDATGTITMS